MIRLDGLEISRMILGTSKRRGKKDKDRTSSSLNPPPAQSPGPSMKVWGKAEPCRRPENFGPSKAKTPESDLEERLANAMEVAKVAEAAVAGP